MKQIIAIDGPAGSGKSSVSKEVAKRLGFGYLDTGAAYRALAWASSEGLVKLEKATAADLVIEFAYAISLDPNNYWVRVGKADVTNPIREAKIAELVSVIAAMGEVRKYMKDLTRSLVNNSDYRGVVVEGRDITTVVFPEAQTRILLTASEEVRLSRRSKELPIDADVAEQVTNRDKKDSKVNNFSKPAPGVTLLDTTELNFDQTVDAVLKITKDSKGS